MPAKTAFRVVHVSGQDEKYKAVELNIHSPTTKGWQSGRFCLYPQDIVIQLERKVRLKKIQLLSHQYLIATKVEFYVGDVPDGHTPSLQNARYTRLGYVALSDNSNSSYKARELKSVHVDAVGVFVKFVIHKNHINKHNLYNQVGIVALNVIGDELNDRLDYPEVEDEKAPSDQALAGLINDTQNISPLDDLAFDMYQDPEVAQIIRKLEKKKQEAALQERYDYAKKLKVAIQELQKVGEKLGKFEVEKRQAVENEDYDKAKLKKVHMDEFRLQVYKELHVQDLLEMTGSRHPQVIDLEPVRKSTPPHLSEMPAVSPVPGQHTPSPRLHEDRPLPAIKREQNKTGQLNRSTSLKLPQIVVEQEDKRGCVCKPRDRMRFPPIGSHKHPEEESETPPSSHTPYEERPLPANKNKGVDQLATDQPEEEPSGTVTGEAEEMSDKDQRNAASAIDEFELSLVSKVYSKVWSNREDGLLELYRHLQELPATTDKDIAKNKFRAATFLIDRALRDKVFAVFNTAFSVLRMMLTTYATKHKIHKSDISYGVEKTLPNLIQKTGDTTVRTRETATKFIIEESKFPEVKALHIVTHECLKPFKLTIAPRLALSRTDLVALLYQEHGLQNSGLSVENVMKFCTQAICHTAGEVREKAEKIIVALYKDVGQPVKEFLPPDDEKVRRNMLYKQLFEAFDRIDGKPTKEELQRQKQQSEAAKQKEIQALQEQLNHLKDMTSGKAPIDDAMLKGDGDGTKAKDKKDKRNKTKSNKPMTTAAADPSMDDEIIGQTDHSCIFCNESNEKFTEEGLDMHYWKNCPMLKRCSYCKQVVEIAGLTDHLLSECESKNNFKKCSHCSEAVLLDDYQHHIADKKHPGAEANKSHCPLCHMNVPQGEDGWKQHLMGKDGCKQNSRRLESLNKQSKIGAGRVAGGRGAKMTPKPGPSKVTPRRT